MKPIRVKERTTGRIITEKVYGDWMVKLLYGNSRKLLRNFLAKNAFVSALFGWWQKRGWTKKNISPFIKKYDVNVKEFEKSQFASFNDFFTRRLKKEARPLDKKSPALIPADGRYLFFPKISKDQLFPVKGHSLKLETLLKEAELAKIFDGGTMVVARLCPFDYHRFHFPVDGLASKAKLLNGPLYSVNPWALARCPSILIENKRYLTEIRSPSLGRVLMIEVGATCVGTVIQTYKEETFVHKGDEKGTFSFGASSLILLFEPNRLELDTDLLGSPYEIYCQMGQSLGSVKAQLTPF